MVADPSGYWHVFFDAMEITVHMKVALQYVLNTI